jgi:hypothetical protein
VLLLVLLHVGGCQHILEQLTDHLGLQVEGR